MDLKLAGKRAVVTGGSRGIGLAAAKALAAEGVDVALISRSQADLDEAAAGILGAGNRPAGLRVLAIAADTTDDESVRAAVQSVVDELGGLDIVVNVAATVAAPGPKPTVESLTDEALRAEIETKVLGYLRTARAAAPHMKSSGWGRIINVAGLAARSSGSMYGTIRNVSVAAMTKNLADELGPFGINVTVVHPGMTVTERIPGLLKEQAEARGVSEDEVLADWARGTSIGRLVTAEEIADVIVFLASPLSAAITGDAIPVGGGVPGPIYY
jgi:NAD(P)-dependent dehydrogenase (short-subunit alcohol dehydrogenase family)